ncbi:hypothetical protein Tco_1195395 [Tanacetum coccineum]
MPKPSTLKEPMRSAYGIRDVLEVDPREAVEELALTTLEGVNARVTEIAAVLEQDTHDIYAVIEDTQNRQTQLFQRVDGLVKDRQFYYETARLLDQEALALQARDQTHADELEGAGSSALNNMPPRRSSATARAAAAAATPMTAAAVEQLIEARVVLKGVVVVGTMVELVYPEIGISVPTTTDHQHPLATVRCREPSTKEDDDSQILPQGGNQELEIKVGT